MRIPAIVMLLLALVLPVRTVLAAAVPCFTLVPSPQLAMPLLAERLVAGQVVAVAIVATELGATEPVATEPGATEAVAVRAPAAQAVDSYGAYDSPGGHDGHALHGAGQDDEAAMLAIVGAHDHGQTSGQGASPCLDCLSSCCHIAGLAIDFAMTSVLHGDAVVPPPPLLPLIERRPADRDRPPRTL